MSHPFMAGVAKGLAERRRVRWGSPASQSEIVISLVRRATLAQDKVTIEIERKALAKHLLDQEELTASGAEHRRPIPIEVPVRFRRRGVEAKLVVRGQEHPASHALMNGSAGSSRARRMEFVTSRRPSNLAGPMLGACSVWLF